MNISFFLLIVLYFSECDHEGIQNRSCRTLANLSKHPGLCENIHKTDFMETLVSRMEATENSHHQHTYCRAVRYRDMSIHEIICICMQYFVYSSINFILFIIQYTMYIIVCPYIGIKIVRMIFIPVVVIQSNHIWPVSCSKLNG